MVTGAIDSTLVTETSATQPSPAPFTPVAAGQRIEALDVIRGVALLAIFLMNIEWFNRPFTSFDEGMPRGLAGLDLLASWFIAYFVAGKFWTIFSLLFGMGFAVMLVRAERAGREFKTIYLRRILALAVIGAVHFIFVWHGDILFSYAVGALALLIVLYGRARHIVIGCVLLLGLGFIPGADTMFAVAGGLATSGLLALYLRNQKRILSMPVFSFLLLLIGLLLSIGAALLWLLPDAPTEPRGPLTVFGALLLITGWLSWRYYEPAEKRSLRMAAGVYVFTCVAFTSMGVVQYVTPDPVAALASAGSSAEDPKHKRAAELKAEREKQLKKQADKKAEEVVVSTTGSYADWVAWHGGRFPEKAAGDAIFAVVLVGVFLLGVWFVRSGVMEDTERHLAFFRKLALYGLPIGIGIGLLTGFIAMSHTPGERYDGWNIARGLLMLANLPACLGYIGLFVTMLHSRTAWSRIRVLAPAGRMALTNYVMQSLISVTVFYGFGLGHWGLPRAQQLVFVVVVFAGQVALSHWWLARFRYGPLEWLWRAVTYWQVPPLRIGH